MHRLAVILLWQPEKINTMGERFYLVNEEDFFFFKAAKATQEIPGYSEPGTNKRSTLSFKARRYVLWRSNPPLVNFFHSLDILVVSLFK